MRGLGSKAARMEIVAQALIRHHLLDPRGFVRLRNQIEDGRRACRACQRRFIGVPGEVPKVRRCVCGRVNRIPAITLRDDDNPGLIEEAPPGPARFVGPYRVLGRLGDGGHGSIFRVANGEGQQFALKRLHSGASNSARERFRREAEVLSRLSHPNVVKVFELAVDEKGRPYFTMELVEGSPLEKLKGRLEPEVFVGIVAKAAEGLHHAHEHGLVHRDVKPHNIVVGRKGEPKVVDFGLAHDVTANTLTQEGDLLGTPLYMAPEQLRGEHDRADRRADVYSLGAVLYELLTLTRPFSGAKGQALLNAIQTETPQEPHRRAPDRDVPRELGAIALKALAKDKATRYPDVEALLADLRAFQEGRPVSAFRDPLPVRLRKWARRHRLLVATTLTAVFVAGLALASLAVYRGQVQAAELEQLQRRQHATVPYLTGMDLLRRRLDVATISSRAVPALERALELDPEFAEARFALGQAYLRCWRVDDALRAMNAALEQQPDNAHWLIQIGRVHQRSLSPRHPDAAKTRAQARTYFARAAALDTAASPFAAIGQALVAHDDGDSAAARAQLERVTAEAPHLWEAWHALGYVTLAGDPAAAEAAFRRALDLEPDEGNAVRGVAAALLAQGRYEAALEHSRRAAELSDPSEALDLVNLGHALFRLQRFEEVIPPLEEALAREPGNPRAEITLGATYQALGRSEDALASFSAAIEHDDGSTGGDAYAGRGGVLLNLGKPKEALADLEVAIERSPEGAQNWANRAFARMQLGQLTEAQADLDEALQRDPTLGSAWANLAGVREALGDTAGAVEALDRGIEHEPDNGQLWMFRGQFHLEGGRPREAAADLEQALRVGGAEGLPLPPETTIMLLRAYRRSGQPDKVLTAIEDHGDSIPPRLQRLLNGEAGLAHFAVAQALCAEQKLPEALPHLRRSNALEPQTGNAFLAAQVAAQVGELEEALDFLEAWHQRGGEGGDALDHPALAPLRELPRFQALRAALDGE